MNGLLFLNSEDFQLQNGTKGPIMCTNIRGFSLILFYSTQCQYCQSLIPIFKNLPGKIGGCQFGMINVSQNKKCVLMSRKSIAPIKVVPYIILYVNGKPYMRYNGPQDANEITRFVVEISKKIRSQENFIQNDSRIKKGKGNDIPAYTIGKPLCGPDDKVCYLEFDTAYDKEKKGNTRDRPRQHLPVQAGMGQRSR